MAIGPRACPKGWDPQASVDCEPGELMEYDGSACPEGFVLTEDEVACIPFFQENCGEMEIPVLGGGCKKVGPDWGEEGEPYFDYCEAGHLALPGGGCVQVGPRACPKLWDPEADVDCEIGDVLPCEEGWSESADGLHCEPVYDECPFGERPLLGGGCERVIPLAEDCPPGPFPEAPEGAADVVYVLAESSCTENCGSKQMPYAEIQAAVDNVPEGGWVLVGEGAYGEGLVLKKPFTLVGLCAGKVTIAGVVETTLEGGSKSVQAGIALVDTHDVKVSGVSVQSQSVGVAVDNAQAFVLEGVEVSGSAGAAVRAGADSQGTLAEVWIHDTVPAPQPDEGEGGLLVSGGAQVVVESSLLEFAQHVGAYAEGPGSALELRNSTVRDTRQTPGDAKSGYGIWLTLGADLVTEGAVLERNTTVGLKLSYDTHAQVLESVVRHTQSAESGKYGRGVQANEGTKATLSRTIVDGNAELGVMSAHSGSELTMERCVVRGTKKDGLGNFGRGIEARDSTEAVIVGSVVNENRGAGVVVDDEGTFVAMAGCLSRNGLSVEMAPKAQGVYVGGGATVQLSYSVLEANNGAGVAAIEPGAVASVSDCRIHGTVMQEGMVFGFGFFAADGAVGTIARSLVEGNARAGVAMYGEETVGLVEDCLVRDTLTADESVGWGVLVSEAAAVTLSRTLCRTSTGVGVQSDGPGTELAVVSSAILETQLSFWDEKHQGIGVVCSSGSKTTVTDASVKDSLGLALLVADEGTEVVMTGSYLGETLPGPDYGYGTAGRVQDGAGLSFSEGLMSKTAIIGLDVGTGGRVVVSRTTIKETVTDAEGDFGYGINAAEGGVVELIDSLVERNGGAGVVAFLEGTRVSLAGSTVSKNGNDASSVPGWGVAVAEGVTLTVSGSVVDRSAGGGIIAAGEGTSVGVGGTLVLRTELDLGGQNGQGFLVLSGTTAEVVRTRLEANHTAAALVDGDDTHLAVRDSLVANTLLGGSDYFTGDQQAYGDGVVASSGAALEIVGSILVDNERCGAFFHAAAGSLTDCIVAGNQAFGLALDVSGAEIQYADAGNHIFGNASTLPPEAAAQVTTDPVGLSPPSAPSVARMPEMPEREDR